MWYTLSVAGYRIFVVSMPYRTMSSAVQVFRLFKWVLQGLSRLWSLEESIGETGS